MLSIFYTMTWGKSYLPFFSFSRIFHSVQLSSYISEQIARLIYANLLYFFMKDPASNMISFDYCCFLVVTSHFPCNSLVKRESSVVTFEFSGFRATLPGSSSLQDKSDHWFKEDRGLCSNIAIILID
jgi:hypothetical protein